MYSLPVLTMHLFFISVVQSSIGDIGHDLTKVLSTLDIEFINKPERRRNYQVSHFSRRLFLSKNYQKTVQEGNLALPERLETFQALLFTLFISTTNANFVKIF